MMIPRFNRHTRLVVILALVATTLLTIVPISSAQTQFSLTESYTWEPYNLSVRYPADWTVLPKETSISLRPNARDVSDGFGPELVIFETETGGTSDDDLTDTIRALASDINGISDTPQRGSLDGHMTMTAALEWATPAASGEIALIVLDAQTVIGMAYIVRDTDQALYGSVLAGIALSIRLDAAAASTPTSETSQTVASVRLTQTYTWDMTGLIFHLPANWETELTVEDGLDQLRFFTPDTDDYEGGGLLFEKSFGMTIDDMVSMIDSDEFKVVAGPVDTVIAGYDATVFDAMDTSGITEYLARTAIIDLDNIDMYVMIAFAADQSVWDDFRPTVSAMLSSIEAAPNSRAAQVDPAPARVSLIANTAVQPEQRARPPIQGDEASDPARFVWEEYNVSFDLPEGWVSEVGNGQEYDLMLISPAAIQTGIGPTIRLTGLPMLGATPEFVDALQSLSSQTGSAVLSPYSFGGITDAVGINFSDEQGNAYQFLILPYGDRGDAIYIQTTMPSTDALTVITILNSIEIEPLETNWTMIDAAWQASLAENDQLTIGDPDAPIRMREYMSFTCGHCIHYSRSLERLIALDVAEGNVLLDIVPLPGDSFATTAALATLCATEQGKGYTAHELLLQAVVELGTQNAYSRDTITALLGGLGLDTDELNACIDEERYGEVLAQNSLAFADGGMTGTPTIAFSVDGDSLMPIFLPDGQVFSGAIPLQWLREIVSRWLDQGIKPADFFVR